MKCRWCNGSGYDRTPGESVAYRCPDCGGTGETAGV